jgi:hypothetical protein
VPASCLGWLGTLLDLTGFPLSCTSKLSRARVRARVRVRAGVRSSRPDRRPRDSGVVGAGRRDADKVY